MHFSSYDTIEANSYFGNNEDIKCNIFKGDLKTRVLLNPKQWYLLNNIMSSSENIGLYIYVLVESWVDTLDKKLKGDLFVTFSVVGNN